MAPFLMSGGEGGIRTPGPLPVNGFQDRRIRPLCHLSLDFYVCRLFYGAIAEVTIAQSDDLYESASTDVKNSSSVVRATSKSSKNSVLIAVTDDAEEWPCMAFRNSINLT